MSLYSSDVKIDPTLSGTLSGVGTPAYNTINSNYDAAKKKLMGDASARGMNGAAAVAPGSYAGTRLAATQGLDTGNLETALGQGIGSTAYNNTLQNREYNQNTQLANEIGALNKPDLLQQILSGVGNVGGTAAGIYGAWGKNAKAPTPASPVASYQQPPSYYDFG